MGKQRLPWWCGTRGVNRSNDWKIIFDTPAGTTKKGSRDKTSRFCARWEKETDTVIIRWFLSAAGNFELKVRGEGEKRAGRKKSRAHKKKKIRPDIKQQHVVMWLKVQISTFPIKECRAGKRSPCLREGVRGRAPLIKNNTWPCSPLITSNCVCFFPLAHTHGQFPLIWFALLTPTDGSFNAHANELLLFIGAGPQEPLFYMTYFSMQCDNYQGREPFFFY
jgi:hypothetical protein